MCLNAIRKLPNLDGRLGNFRLGDINKTADILDAIHKT